MPGGLLGRANHDRHGWADAHPLDGPDHGESAGKLPKCHPSRGLSGCGDASGQDSHPLHINPISSPILTLGRVPVLGHISTPMAYSMPNFVLESITLHHSEKTDERQALAFRKLKSGCVSPKLDVWTSSREIGEE
jgi:hypothetical protein